MFETRSVGASSSAVFDTRGTYLFAVTHSGADVASGASVASGTSIEIIQQGRLAGLAASFDISERGATDEMKRCHDAVLRNLTESIAFVPMAEGTTFGGPDGVRTFLAEFEKAFSDELERIGRAVEFDLRLVWDVDECFDLLAERHPRLSTLQQKAEQSTGSEARRAAFQIGRAYDDILQRERREHLDRLEEALGESCLEIRHFDCTHESELARLRCLVHGDDAEAFEQHIYDLADSLADETRFDLTEPRPPKSFTEDKFELIA